MRIKDYFLIKNGYAFKSESFVRSGIPVVKIQNIINNTVDLNLKNADYVPQEFQVKFSGFIIKRNDILIALSGATLGKFAFYDHSQVSLLNQRVALIRPLNETTNVKYLYYYLFQIIDKIKAKEKGGAQPNISTVDIENTEINLPSPEIQNRIVLILDRLQMLISNRRRTLSLIEDLRRSIFLDMFGDPKENLNEYKLKPLTELIEKDTAITYGIVQAGENYEGGVPYIRSGDIKNGKILVEKLLKTDPKISEKFKRSECKAGDIVISIRASVGSCALIDKDLEGANLNRGVARISPNSKKIDSIFFYNLIQTKGIQEKINSKTKGAVFKEITISDLKSLELPIPKISKQKIFSKKISEILAHKEKLEYSLTSLENLFRSFIQFAFSEEKVESQNDLSRYLEDVTLQQELLERIINQDFQLKEEYDDAKTLLFAILESKKGRIVQSINKEESKIKLEIM